MYITTQTCKILDHAVDCLQIIATGNLTSEMTPELRNCISSVSKENFSIVYLDLKNTQSADLSGINEVIHAHYSLAKRFIHLVLVYRKDSPIEKWVQTTKLHTFVDTAIIA